MKNKLKRAIERSELAYFYYLEDKKYFQAIRIYKANTVVYELLEEYLNFCEAQNVKIVCQYLFHLEDWFNQFEMEIKDKNMQLSQEFIFQRLEKSIAYPKEFINTLL